MQMQTKFISDQQITYDGRQLAPHWIYRRHDMLGDAAVAFIGPCNVELTEMVDIEDVKKVDPIYSPLMLHFIIEFYECKLHQTVYRQRMLIVHAKEWLERRTTWRVERDGDDIYITRPDESRGKLSVSIATASVTSTLIHTAFNILTEGTPVPTVGLAEMGIEPAEFAQALLSSYAAEVEDIRLASCKVRAVTE